MKKIIILGSGAIGSTLGALFSKKYDVLLIGRKNHVEKIEAKGLQLIGDINENFYIKTSTKLTNIEPETIIFLTVKVHDTHRAILEIRDQLKTDTVIICIQNGIGSEDIVKNLVTNKIIRATTFISATFLEPGKIEVGALGKTIIPKEEKDLAKIFIDANIPIELTENIKDTIWRKIIINCVINGLGAVLQVENNKLQSAYLADIKKEIINECITVARKENVIIQSSIIKSIDAFIKKSTNINSTLQDLMRHKTTEIDLLNGAIVQLGNKHNIKTPVNKIIWNFVKARESLYS